MKYVTEDYCSEEVCCLLKDLGFIEFNPVTNTIQLDSAYKYRPTQNIVRKWIESNYGYVIEILIDGWGDDCCVTTENFGYRAFIWKYGDPAPKPYDDIGMSKSKETIINSALMDILQDINKHLTK